MLQIESIAHKSPYKNLYPKVRVLIAFAMVWIGTLIKQPEYHIVVLALSLFWMVFYTKLKIKFFLGWLSPLFVFSFFAMLILPIDDAILLLVRSLGNSALVLTIIFTVPMKCVMDLFKKVLPNAVAELLETCYRVIFVLLEIAYDMVKATSLRFGYNSPRRAIQSTVNLSAVLFIKTLDRAVDMEQALSLRTFDEE